MLFSVPGQRGTTQAVYQLEISRASERLLWASALKPSVENPGADWANDA